MITLFPDKLLHTISALSGGDSSTSSCAPPSLRLAVRPTAVSLTVARRTVSVFFPLRGEASMCCVLPYASGLGDRRSKGSSSSLLEVKHAEFLSVSERQPPKSRITCRGSRQ